MNIALWIVQVLLALGFLAAGSLKVTQPVDKLKKNMNWVEHTTPTIVRVVGILEILGAIGLILPAVTSILPWLVPIAAIGLVLAMIGALIVHVGLKEYSGMVAPVILLLLAVFVAYGRFMVPLS